MRTWIGRCAGAGFAGAWVLVASCANRSEAVIGGSIDASRVVENTRVDFTEHPSHAERFGLSRGASTAATTQGEARPPIAWKAPTGWTELPASSMRIANFRPGGDEQAECYLTMLGGEAGGLAANINRWRSQLSLPGLSAKDVEQLPQAAFFRRQAALVEATGTWKGMSGSDTRPDWSLIAVALVDPSGSAFLKMTGPKELVASEREAFLALAASFGPDGHGAGEPSHSASGFTFELPNAWRRASDKPSRSLSFWAGEGETVECYITVLGGQAGGELANVNRWRTQLGLVSVDQAAVEELAPFTMLGRPARIVELEGSTSATYGVTCMGDDKSVFLKMTGPVEFVRTQRSAMLAFAASLEEAK